VPAPRALQSLSPTSPATLLGGVVIVLLAVHEWREITSRPPFSAPV
jgi:hypothetical protein